MLQCADCLDQEKEIRRKIAELKAEQARVPVPVSAAKKPAASDTVEELEEESVPLLDSQQAVEAAKLDKDQLIAYAVLFVVLVVIGTLLCRVYRTVS